MILNRNSQIISCEETKPVQYAVSALYRDMKAVFTETDAPGDAVHLVKDSDLAPECFCLQVHNNSLLLTAADTLGFVYGLFEVSRRFLGVQPFWFWNDQKFIKTDSVTVPQNFTYESKPARVRYRGWFVNDETLISHWKVERRSDLSFAMVFETLLRLGGNLVIPGTGENGHRYHDLAADMGLIITHHHAEPLGAKMFVQAYPELEPKFSLYPEKFRALWQDAIDRQKIPPTVWNIGFRGQGDKPFWEDDPQYDTLTRSIAVDSNIQEQLNALAQADPQTANYYYLLTGVRPLLLEKIYQDRQINSLQYTDLNGHTLTIGQDMPDPGVGRQTALEMTLNATPGGFVIQTSDSADFPYILCGRRILRSQDMSLKKLGTIVVALDVGKLLDNEIHSLSSQPSELYLYNGTQLIYHSGEEAAAALPQEESAHGYRISTIGGKKYYICWLTSSVTGLRLCSVFDYHQIYGQINTARNALIFGECAILLLFAWVLLHMARLVTKPIHTLSEAMQTVDQQEGNFSAARALLPADPAADEIGTLTREFDSMLGKIDTLIHENYEKQLLLQETRYKMLQAQINPHFLYNTLGTLNWLVKAGNREDACKMIVSLGDILRAALSPRQNSAADVHLAESYIAIQQLRYRSRAEFDLTSSGELEQWYLPHFTLQPLVENAIHYGVEDSDEVCRITVSVQAEGDTLTLLVHNTGAPVAPERLAEIRTFTVKPQGHGIGLKNIYERLSMLYENFVFDFDSDETGTTVHIVLRQSDLKAQNLPSDA